VDVAGARVLFVALDLACCGGMADVEDRLRRIQADAVRAAMARALDDADVAGVVVGGDFNLVGSTVPLDILRAGLAPAGGGLEPVYALQLDGRSTATWRQRGPFPPGRLDWLLHSPGTLDVARAFVFEAADLTEAALRSLDLTVDDHTRTSDHLPLVVDLRRR
jgi:endonuclease/exonuclease/phosphatase family metal-dependent hydrolase